MKEFPNTKIIMTSRENYADFQDYKKCFGSYKFETRYICPFDMAQRNEYISKFVQTVQGLKKYYLDFDSFDQVHIYENYFRDYAVLLELTQVPFTLRIIMNILPQLVKKIEKDRLIANSIVNNIYLSRQNIFEVFVKFYYNNEVKRFVHDEVFSEFLKDYFEIEERKDFYDESRMEELFELINLINETISWDFLEKQKLIFSWENVQILLNSGSKRM